jgi:hypothetical protein
LHRMKNARFNRAQYHNRQSCGRQLRKIGGDRLTTNQQYSSGYLRFFRLLVDFLSILELISQRIEID